MPEQSAIDLWNRRLPLYAYLEPILAGRSILEVGCGVGLGAEYLAAHGAQRVTAVDNDPAQVERARARYRRSRLEFRAVAHLADLSSVAETFDVVIVPEADLLVRRGEAITGWKRLLAPAGRLVVAVTSADRHVGAGPHPVGLGYYDLSDSLAPHFPRVRMFGQTPFLGFGMVEFEGAAEALRVDSRLVEGGAEPASFYVAIAGPDQPEDLGYSLVQIPFAAVEARLAGGSAGAESSAADNRAELVERRLEETERKARARLDEAEGKIAELRRKLDDALVQSESAMRISRAQGDEIDELRARVRRAFDDRAALDGEISKLRRALSEADESVIALTRKTTDEMAAVAERLASGLRAPAETEGLRERLAEHAALRDEVDRLRANLAETEARASAAERRLEEVATDGREKTIELDDLRMRLRRTEDALGRERTEVATLQERLRANEGELRKLEERALVVVERDERIARLEGEKQDLSWRMAELEEKLRGAIARLVTHDAGTRGALGAMPPPPPYAHAHAAATVPAPAPPPAPTASPTAPPEELASLRASRDRAIEQFHKAASAHAEEATRLKSAVAEQAALVAELEDALKNAEMRATVATREAAELRRSSKELEEADRTRRSRLAELEGKLLRLEHEKKSAVVQPAAASAPAGELERKLEAAVTEREALRTKLEQSAQAAVSAEEALRKSDEALRKANEHIVGTHQRVRTLEAEAVSLKAELTSARQAATTARAPSNGRDASRAAAAAGLARELAEIEEGLRDEAHALSLMEATLQAELEERQASSQQAAPGGFGAIPGGGSAYGQMSDVGDGDIDIDLDDSAAEVILLQTTLANFRRRAARLRDEIEGCRRRLESLSPSEMPRFFSGFLEELGEDLAEFENP
jgi:SAM-dependent methyltransferase